MYVLKHNKAKGDIVARLGYPLTLTEEVDNRAAMGYDRAVILCTVGDSAQDDTAVHLWMLLCAIHSVCYGLTE